MSKNYKICDWLKKSNFGQNNYFFIFWKITEPLAVTEAYI